MFGIIIGAKRGFTYQLIKMLGIFLVLTLSFLLKNKLIVLDSFCCFGFSFNNLSDYVNYNWCKEECFVTHS